MGRGQIGNSHQVQPTVVGCSARGEVESFTIDVVHRSYFNEFLRTMKGHLYKTMDAIRKNRDELLKKAKEDRMRLHKEATNK
jgi:hypothetical protein